MQITRQGHRYIDAASGKTIDVWFPRSGKPLTRSCLALEVGILRSDFVTVTIETVESKPTST